MVIDLVLPRIVPVVDIYRGEVVHAVGGRREEYFPLRSPILSSTDPRTSTKELLHHTGSQELYFADLDSIRHGVGEVDWSFLTDFDAELMIDHGGQSDHQLKNVREVVGLETSFDPELVTHRFKTYRPPLPPIFSLDLQAGQLMGAWRNWGARRGTEIFRVVDRVFEIGFRSLIVLDLAGVGSSQGPLTLKLCEQIRERYPSVELISGGGVSGWDDVRRFGNAGVDAVLVASAIHDGRLRFPPPSS